MAMNFANRFARLGNAGKRAKIALAALAIALTLAPIAYSPALAYSKARNLTCQQMRNMVNQRGKVYFFTRFGKTELFVNNAGYCIAENRRLGYFSVIDKTGKYCSLRYCSDGGYHDFGN